MILVVMTSTCMCKMNVLYKEIKFKSTFAGHFVEMEKGDRSRKIEERENIEEGEGGKRE